MTALPPDLFVVWTYDEIFTEPGAEPLYVASLCRDCPRDRAQVVRGYDPRDGIFERPGTVVESLGGIDTCKGEYAREIERELLAEFEARREAMIVRGEN